MSTDLASPRGLPRLPTLGFGALSLVGIGVFLVGVTSADSETVERTYRVFLQNWLFWASLSQGALMLSVGFRLTNARWPGPIHRLTDSLGAFIPVSLVLFAFVWIGRHSLFEWVHQPVHGKEWWFNETAVFTRDLMALLWMTILSLLYLYQSVRPMLGEARETATGVRGALYRRWAAGWRGEERERDLATLRLRRLGAALAISYAFAYSVIAVDMIMGLAPHWVSTMFPAYYCWGGFLSAISMTTLIALLTRNSDELRDEVTPSRRHDLGKMVFAFSIFWMYLFWSQYLVIWYGNIPEETGFVAARLGSQFLQDTWYLQGFWSRIAEPYVRITLTAWILCWVVPFWVLLGRKPKMVPSILGLVAFGSLVGFYLERYILITPSLVTPEAVLAGAPVTPFGVVEIGIALGFLGAFFLSVLTFQRVFPGALPAGR